MNKVSWDSENTGETLSWGEWKKHSQISCHGNLDSFSDRLDKRDKGMEL